ncbi:(2Fe-2S)-binding protein [Amphritea sp. HPY]|uniref:(2Fe-2S)-binding protein n=1 Tax=Amphritea sp. HPY TaxID=3421652 RepID=UPI003D7E973E
MFRSLTEKQKHQSMISLTINDKPVTVPEGSTLWAAMALAGETATRISPVTRQSRSAYCAMGICFECMVEIDGMPNQQACLTQVREGMTVNCQVITEHTSLLDSAMTAPSATQTSMNLAQEVGGDHA